MCCQRVTNYDCDKKANEYIQHRFIMITIQLQNSTSTTDDPHKILIPIYMSAPMTYSLVK